ncbi:MAG: VWA domain-containing protein, partial [Anaerolineae bacterium]|nr:VWA domain-containing protein [Anaerolineae bacterium]
MKTGLLLVVTLILSFSAALPAAAEAPITVRIDRADAAGHPRVVLEATVRNEYGVPIPGLTAANFDVSEDRSLKSRPIVAVEPFVNPDVQLSVVLAVDVSGSMAGAKLRDAQEAARRFLDRLTSKDHAALIAFSDLIALDAVDATREVGFGADKAALYGVVDRLQAKGWTPLYDTAYKAVRWAATAPAGNRAVLLFTDGKEEKAPDGAGGSRVANDDSPIREANRAGVPVFTIGLGADADEAYLKRLALETGGTYQHADNSAELAQLFRNVSELLKQQYRITYTSGLPADGQTHQVLLAVT